MDEIKFDDTGAGPNTIISYMYRDASNYKQFRDVCIAGRITRDQLDRFVLDLDEGFRFVPGQVGLPDLQGEFDDGWDYELDHPYHELLEISYTDAAPNSTLTAAALADALATTEWNALYDPR